LWRCGEALEEEDEEEEEEATRELESDRLAGTPAVGGGALA
jgi:hypothetical protein